MAHMTGELRWRLVECVPSSSSVCTHHAYNIYIGCTLHVIQLLVHVYLAIELTSRTAGGFRVLAAHGGQFGHLETVPKC